MSYLGKQPAFAPLVSADITSALGFTPIQLTSLSATQNLSYNSTTGQFTGPDLSGYLTSATAASTYLTQANAASTYQTQAGMSSYLTTSAASSTYLPLSGGTLAGSLSFSGATRRITGDFSSNNPITDRILVQTSTTNGNTLFSILPNGTSTTTRYVAFNNSDPTNAGALQLAALSTDVRIQSFANGTGTAIPLLLMMGGTAVAQISTGNNFLIGTATDDATNKLQLVGSARVQAAATQDAVIVAGRAGGTDSFAVTITPMTLSASRTLTLPDNSGTLLTTGAAVTATQGGTSQTTYTTGDILYASASNTLSKLGIGTTGQVLTVTGGVPTWAAAGGGGGISTGKSVAMSMIFGF